VGVLSGEVEFSTLDHINPHFPTYMDYRYPTPPLSRKKRG